MRPDCASRIAEICADWARLEHALIDAFSILTNPIDLLAGGGKRVRLNIVAAESLKSLDSLHQRLKVMENCFRAVLPEAALAEFGVLAAEVRKCASLRNNVAHSVWYVSDDYPGLIQVKAGAWAKQGDYTKWSLHDFDLIVERLWTANGMVARFADWVAQMVGTREPAPVTDAPTVEAESA